MDFLFLFARCRGEINFGRGEIQFFQFMLTVDLEWLWHWFNVDFVSLFYLLCSVVEASTSEIMGSKL